MSDDIRPPWEDPPPEPPAPAEPPNLDPTLPAPPPPLRLIPGRKANGDNKFGRKLSRRTLENLTPKMLEVRNRFIAEYVKDFKGPEAYIRATGKSGSALKMSAELLREPYVSTRIWDVIDSMSESEMINTQRILAGLIREANYAGMGASHGARVTAWTVLAKIKGMVQNNVNIKGEMDHKGGVMLVPVNPSEQSWEEATVAAQQKLKESAAPKKALPASQAVVTTDGQPVEEE